MPNVTNFGATVSAAAQAVVEIERTWLFGLGGGGGRSQRRCTIETELLIEETIGLAAFMWPEARRGDCTRRGKRIRFQRRQRKRIRGSRSGWWCKAHEVWLTRVHVAGALRVCSRGELVGSSLLERISARWGLCCARRLPQFNIDNNQD